MFYQGHKGQCKHVMLCVIWYKTANQHLYLSHKFLLIIVSIFGPRSSTSEVRNVLIFGIIYQLAVRPSLL